jgi:hypothetical protein
MTPRATTVQAVARSPVAPAFWLIRIACGPARGHAGLRVRQAVAEVRGAGQGVVEHLRTRRDTPGALLALQDGRYAVTGPLLAIGAREALSQYARRRLRQSRDDSERASWEEVIGALAHA